MNGGEDMTGKNSFPPEQWENVNMPAVYDEGLDSKRLQELEYPVVVQDDKNNCYTAFLFGSNTRISNDHADDEHFWVSQKHSEVQRNSRKILGFFYLNSAERYGDIIQLNVEHKPNVQERQTVTFSISYASYTEGKIVSEFNRAGIVCFNAKIKNKMLNSCLQQLIQMKMVEKELLPTVCGFGKWKEQWVFAAEELYHKNGLPVLVTKHFDTSIDESFDSIGKRFEQVAKAHSDSKMFLTLTLLRVTAMLTTVLARAGIHIPKIIFVQGNPAELAKYFQIYDRKHSAQDVKEINVSEAIFLKYLEGVRDDVLLFEDDESDSIYKKKQGTERVNDIRKMLNKNQEKGELESPFLPIVFSTRLAQEVNAEYALIVDASSMKCEVTAKKAIVDCLYDFDRKLVNRICSEMSDFVENMKSMYSNLLEQTKKCNLHSGNGRITLAILLTMHWEIINVFCPYLQNYFSWNDMCEFLINLVKKSESSCCSGDRSKEFANILAQMIATDEVKLFLNLPLSKGENCSSKKISVFVDEKYLYFPDDAFTAIANKMQSSPTPSVVRKFLKEAGLLKYNTNTLMTQVTLGYRQYVTAVKRSILSKRSLSKIRGGNYNFTPCQNSGDTRIPVGTDELGRMVFLSPQHPKLNNKHIQIIGDSGSGKSTAGNLIVRAKYQQGENIIFVDYSNSNSKSKMLSHGFDVDFYDQHIRVFDIEQCINEETLQSILQEMRDNRIIPLFSTPKYDECVEELLSLLYDLIVKDESLTATLVIDEIHELDYGKTSALCHIMEKGRGNGITLISIFQAPHELKPAQLSRLNQASVKLIFGLNDRDDAEKCISKIGLKPRCKFVELLGDMSKRNCLVVGYLEDATGEMRPKRYIKVEIPNIN